MSALLSWIKARLSEPSTWGAISVFCIGSSTEFKGTTQIILLALGAGFAAIAAGKPDSRIVKVGDKPPPGTTSEGKKDA